MSKVAVVYWSGTGNTKTMADAVAEGAKASGGAADIFDAKDFSADKAKEYDSIALGCPAMGAEILEEGEFQPMYDSIKTVLGGKKVGLFGSYGWGDGQWMRDWEADCKSTGCTLLSDTITANGAPDDTALDKCKEMGKALTK